MKFKMSKIAAAVVAVGAIGSAQAVTVNQDGLGEVLLVPYYNVNNNFQTNIHIVNTKNESKIVKVRFRESGNSQDVLDFNIYMSPYDVWTGVVRNVNGKANLISTDNTCTLPLNDSATSVGTLNSTGWNMNTVYPDVEDSDAREGYVEIIEVGVIKANQYADTDGNGTIDNTKDMEIVAGIKHGSDGKPADCSVITSAWTNGVGTNGNAASRNNWGTSTVSGATATYVGDSDANAALSEPTGGLYGHAIYLNNATGAAYVAQDTALSNYANKSQHYRPDDPAWFLLPSLASGDVRTSGVVNAGGDAIVNPGSNWPLAVDATLNDGDKNTPASGNNPFPMAHAMQAVSVLNDYFIDPTYDGATDWVVTFPMRKHGIFNGQYTEDCDDDGTEESSTQQVTFNADNVPTAAVTESDPSDVCFEKKDQDVAIQVQPFDREEQQPAPGGFGVSPVLGSPDTILEREVNILNFQSTASSVLGSDNAKTINTGTSFVTGWMKLTFNNKYEFVESQLSDATVDFADADGGADGGTGLVAADHTFEGVPVIGFAALRGKNPVGSSFGETVDHRFERDVTVNSDDF
ncbi:MAG: hypothetical protein AXA67_07245 [Methylothermaceae bacteria B42]|nr:MAG: hypothetical protein AXA67_07245 [Methylothermaceae bacteria B42]HHJ40180.1 hypothetical protein [Methylothermaceae bacterium]